MVYEKNLKHLTVPPENSQDASKVSENKRYSICCTSMGHFSCRVKPNQSRVEQSMGLGMSIYFKQMKALTMLFFFFSFIQIPAFILYYFGGNANDVTSDSKIFFSMFTLGNLGQYSS